MFSDILSTIKNDTKILQNSIIISQIELWEADKMLNKLNFLETLNYSMNNYKN